MGGSKHAVWRLTSGGLADINHPCGHGPSLHVQCAMPQRPLAHPRGRTQSDSGHAWMHSSPKWCCGTHAPPSMSQRVPTTHGLPERHSSPAAGRRTHPSVQSQTSAVGFAQRPSVSMHPSPSVGSVSVQWPFPNPPTMPRQKSPCAHGGAVPPDNAPWGFPGSRLSNHGE